MNRDLPFRLLAVLICVLALKPGMAHAQDRVPNIIFVMADDLGYGDVGFNGQEHIRTPNLDAMAEEGIVFTDHYAGSSVCMPSRCALLTGYHMGHATVRGNPRWTFVGHPVNLGPKDVTVADELKRAGYTTAIIGKWGLAEGGDDRGLPSRQGFDYFYGYRDHGAAHHYYPETFWRNDREFKLEGNNTKKKQGKYAHDLVTDDALRWILEHKDEPFFLFLSYTIPHLELTVPEDSTRQYRDLGWPKRMMNTEGHYHNDPEGNLAYAGMVSRMDRDLGRLRDLIDELGLAEETLIIFTSDNGPEYEKQDRFFNSNGPFRGGKRDLYEGGIRVPFVAVWPGTIEAGTRSDHPSAFWDLLPTACDIAGVEPSQSDLDGISYLPTLLGRAQDQQTHDALYWEFNERQGPIQAVRVGDWKAVRFVPKDKLELYNLAEDPGERQDVSEQYPQVALEMRQIMAQSRTDNPAFKLEKHKKAK